MAFKVKQIVYKCQSATCAPDVNKKKMQRGNIVLMIADNIDAQITFTTSSPFKSGAMSITILKGTIVGEFVKSNAAIKSYPYNLNCTSPSCAGIRNPPEMIVDG